MDVIEPSSSAWRNPIVLVPKPDGSIRFYINIKEVASFNAYPMPCFNVLLSCLSKARFISTLDLTKVYWQVLLWFQDKPKVAFTTL